MLGRAACLLLIALAGCESATSATSGAAPRDVDAASPPVTSTPATGDDADVPVDAGAGDAPTTIADAAPDQALNGCIKSTGAGHRVFVCGRVRYDVEVPTACPSGGCGLVLDVHGLTMNGDQEDDNTGLRQRANARGYIVVQPTAPAGLLGPSWSPGVDDDDVWSFVREVVAQFGVDPKRVHITGFSQGGAMTFRLVCKHGAEIASAAPIAAADAKSLSSNTPPFRLDCTFAGADVPARAVPLLHMHGKKDALVPIAKGREQRDAVLAWMGPATTQTIASSAEHTWTRYTNASGAVYEYVEHDWTTTSTTVAVPIAGHCFPGGQDLSGTLARPLYFTCTPPTAFTWGDVVLDFFDAHAL